MYSKSKLSVLSFFVIVGLIGLARFIFAAADWVPGDQPTGSIAPLAVTNFNLTSGEETVFKTDYQREFWTGNVYAFPVTADGAVQLAERWTDGVSSHINAQDFDSGRKIVTLKKDGTKIPFRWASLDPAQQTQVTSALVVDFVRGDRSQETGAGGFRVRASVLGDIIHSNPVYMKNGTSPVLFVGANDGMVHVFNASSGTGGGDELWAYVPSMLMSQLPLLKANPYVHTYFVDGGLNLRDAVIGGVTKKILVGGLGAGGKGLFALDVTNPLAADEATAASKILWEITPTTINNAASGSYANMGYTYGTPVIVPVNSGAGQSAVIIGNGYIGGSRSSLFVINAADGTLIKELVVPTASPSGKGGLSTPACIDSTSDGRADYCYAGDIDGKLWKFDLSSSGSGSWSVSLLHATSPAQAITTAPTVGVHPNGGFMVNFGTGRMFTTADTTDTATFYAYGIWDGAPVANAVLLAQTLTEKSYVSAGVTTRVRITSNNTPNWTSGAANHYGWRAALPAGERVLNDTIFIESGRFYFNSTNPTIVNTAPTPYGENWQMELDFVTGGTVNSPFLDLDNDQLLTDLDRLKYQTGDTLPTGKVVGSPISTSDGIAVGKFASNGVGSHPLLVQLATLNTTLFNQNPDVIFPAPPPTSTDRGVSGGHFDVDIFYGPKPGTDICNNSYTGAVAGAKATGKIRFNWGGTKILSALNFTVGGETVRTGDPGTVTEGGMSSYIGVGSTTSYDITFSGDTVTITAKNTGTAYNAQPIVITATGMATGERTITNLAGGVNTVGGVRTYGSCSSHQHFHQYDDTFDVTGVNMLNASSTTLNAVNGIPSTSTQFKVLVQNQYLSPAVALLVGPNPYESVKTYNNLASETVAANVIKNAPVYTRANIGNLVFNMPTDAFKQKDWWGNGDVRVGLHPTVTGCVKSSSFGQTLFNPVIPPANGTNGPGTNGTTTGVRHNGALTIQLIRADTPDTAIEMNDSLGRPEYGWRVKNAQFEDYVLTEWTVFWHHGGKCYGAAGWTKIPPEQAPSTAGGSTPAAGSDDPKIGSFVATSATVSVTTTVSGNVTTTVTTYADKTTKTVTKTVNSDGTVTIVTQLPDGTSTTVTIANPKGAAVAGGDEKGTQAKTGRISWSELIRK